MKREQIDKIKEMYRNVKRLEDTIEKADKMIRSWRSKKKDFGPNTCIDVTLYQKGHFRWSTGYEFSADMISSELIPILVRIRDSAKKELEEYEG